MVKRSVPGHLEKILEYDAALTKRIVTRFLKFTSFKSLRAHAKFLEISCNGIVWLSAWLGFIWIFDNKHLYQMQLNMLFGLILDIVIIALLKATVRRRRPAVCDDMMVIGPDKFSFPSGHASRATFILFFFLKLYPISVIFWPPIIAWVTCVCLSRLFLERHYLLDITVGIALGFFEAMVICVLWLSENTATSVINFISSDNLPAEPEL